MPITVDYACFEIGARQVHATIGWVGLFPFTHLYPCPIRGTYIRYLGINYYLVGKSNFENENLMVFTLHIIQQVTQKCLSSFIYDFSLEECYVG
jgi:hypothetical protein